VTDPLAIRVEFVGSDGERKNGPLIIPAKELAPIIDDATWSTNRCLQEFSRALRDRDSDAAVACMRALDRLDCWHAAFAQLITDPASVVPGESVVWLWISYGFHVSASLQGDRVLTAVLKALLPPYSGAGINLYRGEAADRYQKRILGMSWTTDIQVARNFARSREPAGIVLKLEASPKMGLSGPTAHSEYLGESEYLLDPSAIGAIEVVGD
jgi:hypothetical protein